MENKFIECNWYEIISGDYIKFTKLEENVGYNKLFYEERINMGNHIYVTDYIASNDIEKYALSHPVDISYISKVLPYNIEPNYEIY